MKWIKKIAQTPLDTLAKVIDSLSSGDNPQTNAPSINAVNGAITTLTTAVNNAKVTIRNNTLTMPLEDIPTPSEPYPDLFQTFDMTGMTAGTYLVLYDIIGDYACANESEMPLSIGYIKLELGWMNSGWIIKDSAEIDLPIRYKNTGNSGSCQFETMHMAKISVIDGQTLTCNLEYYTRTQHPSGTIKVNVFFVKLSA